MIKSNKYGEKMAELAELAKLADKVVNIDISPKLKRGDTIKALIDGKTVNVKVLKQKDSYMDGEANGRKRLFWYNGNEWENKT